MQVQGAARLSARIGVRGYEVQLMKAAKTGIRVTIALIVIVFGSMIYNYRSQNEFYEEFQDMRESLTHFYRDYSPSKLQDVEGMKKAFERVEKIDKPLMKIEEIHKASDKAMKNIEILQNYQLDKTGRVDLALYDSGARIAGVGVTEMFYSCNIFWKFLGCPGKYQGPEMAIKSSMNYEDCFRFKNANGSLYIRLAKPAIVNAVTVEHITKQMSLTGQVTEAPRLLRVSGINYKGDKPFVFGEFEFKANDTSIEIFDMKHRASTTHRIVMFDFLANNGHQKETRVYRMRVHGVVV